MSGAVRAATGAGMVVDTGCETDFWVLTGTSRPCALSPLTVRHPDPSAVALARLTLSGSTGSVDAGVC
jgi:hypothetical protein